MATIGSLTNRYIRDVVDQYWVDPFYITSADSMYLNRPSMTTDPATDPERSGDHLRGYETYDPGTIIWSEWRATQAFRCVGVDREQQYIRTNNRGGSQTKWELYEKNSTACGYVPGNQKTMSTIHIVGTNGTTDTYVLSINGSNHNIPKNGTSTVGTILSYGVGNEAWWEFTVSRQGSGQAPIGRLSTDADIVIIRTSDSLTQFKIYWKDNPSYHNGDIFRMFSIRFSYTL